MLNFDLFLVFCRFCLKGHYVVFHRMLNSRIKIMEENRIMAITKFVLKFMKQNGL
jgi:uncharacterized membrane protein YfbV (UPF0208 family)